MTERNINNHFKDRTIICVDCQRPFIFTAGEQAFFASKRPPLTPPKRCKACRDYRRQTIHPPLSIDKAIERCNSLYGPTDHQGVQQ